MIDLDRFNAFNNTFGHQAGDPCSRPSVSSSGPAGPSEDIACRYGGEEFTLILPEAPFDVAIARAEAHPSGGQGAAA